jgi:histidinol-phosphate aminotransferase
LYRQSGIKLSLFLGIILLLGAHRFSSQNHINMMKPVIYLDRNENQYGPSPDCLKALIESDPNLLYEYSRDFTRNVKSCLSERLASEFGASEKNVILGYGAEDLLKQTVHCYLQKGDKIMIPSHSWWYYKQIADEVDGVKVEYPIVEGDKTFQYDLDGMIRIYQEHQPKMVLISSPNNPTGNCLKSDQLVKVLRLMKETIVVLDQAYTLFYNNDKNHLKELVDEFPNLIILRTFSKYYSLAGLRIGFALIGENHARFSLFSARYLGFNRVSERVAVAALDSVDYYQDMCRKMVADNEMFFNELNKIPGFVAYRSFANFILVKIPVEIKDTLKKYLSDHGMIVKFMAEDRLFNHIRITIGTQEQNRQLLDLIHSFVTIDK